MWPCIFQECTGKASGLKNSKHFTKYEPDPKSEVGPSANPEKNTELNQKQPDHLANLVPNSSLG